MVPNVRAAGHARLGQIDEIAIQRGPVEAAPGQTLDDVCMGYRTARRHQLLKHGHTRQGGSEACLPQRGPELGNLVSLCLFTFAHAGGYTAAGGQRQLPGAVWSSVKSAVVSSRCLSQ